MTQAFGSKTPRRRRQHAVGTGYNLTDGNGGQDYSVHLHSAAGTITGGDLTVAADQQTKVYGDVDPARPCRGGFSSATARYVRCLPAPWRAVGSRQR